MCDRCVRRKTKTCFIDSWQEIQMSKVKLTYIYLLRLCVNQNWVTANPVLIFHSDGSGWFEGLKLQQQTLFVKYLYHIKNKWFLIIFLKEINHVELYHNLNQHDLSLPTLKLWRAFKLFWQMIKGKTSLSTWTPNERKR